MLPPLSFMKLALLTYEVSSPHPKSPQLSAMDSAKIFFYALSVFFIIEADQVNASRVQKFFVFGDSYADTGNLGKLDRSLTRCWYEPYGMTFPRRPSGRFSDGKILPDFIASFQGIRSPVPYKFRRRVSSNQLLDGMNFAVAGTGVFDLGNFQRNLSAQIDTFQAQLNEKIYSHRDLKSSVVLVTISGNDYDRFYQLHRNKNNIWDYIKNVTGNLELELKRIHDLGVKKVVVTNLSPLGCTPLIARSNSYKGCDKFKGSVVDAHNKKLNEVVEELGKARNSSPSDFLVLNLHSAFMSIINQDKGAKKFKNIFRPCCEGLKERFNCGEVDDQGVKQYTVCRNPGDYLYWDSVHPSQAGWDAVFQEIQPWLARNLGRN